MSDETFVAETPVRDYYERSYRRRKKKHRSARTIEDYRLQLKLFEQFFAAQALAASGELGRRPRLCDLSDSLVSAAMDWQAQLRGRTASTANKIRTVLVALWNDAARQKILATRPVVDAFDQPKRIVTCWLPEEMARLLAAAEQANGEISGLPAAHFWRALLTTNYYTGVRVTALMSCRSRDLDLSRKTLVFAAETQKQFADQVFPLPADCLASLAAISPHDREAVFPWPYDPVRIVGDLNMGRGWMTLRRHLKRLLLAAGLPATAKHKFHNIRRTTATRVCAVAGLEAAREYMGHSHRKVTQMYIDMQQAGPAVKPVHLLPPPVAPTPQPPASTPPPKASPLRVFRPAEAG